MHAFNRGFNGNQVVMAKGMQTGQVPLQQAGAAPVPVPAMTGTFGGASLAPKSIQGPAATPKPAPAATPVPAPPPGAVPMGKKANCPVCRTFGG
jgi:hypothetical protein